MTAKARNMRSASSGELRQSCPGNVTPLTFCPAPRQSNTVQPGKPRSRKRSWMLQPKSSRRFGQERPAGLLKAKSADATKAARMLKKL